MPKHKKYEMCANYFNIRKLIDFLIIFNIGVFSNFGNLKTMLLKYTGKLRF